MKKYALIGLAALVPFVALVVYGLKAETPSTPPQAATPAEAMPGAAPVAPALVAAQPEQPLPPAAEAPAPHERDDDEPLAAAAATRFDPRHQDAIRQLKPFIERCYVVHRRLLPNSRIRVRATFSVTPEGTLTQTHLRLGQAPPELKTCLEQALSAATFDVSQGVPEGAVRGNFDYVPPHRTR